VIRLEHCEVARTDWGCETRFRDGTSIGAVPHPADDDYRRVSARLGYGSDVLLFCRDHDAVHSLAAQWFQGRPSAVLWALAHGLAPGRGCAVQEEAFVQVCQRWLRAGERPIIGDADWHGFKRWALGHLEGWV
jgi:hypothetical protein